jgi:hypothetical protein
VPKPAAGITAFLTIICLIIIIKISGYEDGINSSFLKNWENWCENILPIHSCILFAKPGV